MEINITSLMARSGDMGYYSGSRMELGDDAGRITWDNSMDAVEDSPLLTDEQLPEFRDYVREFGAWEDEEIDAWDSQECNALFLQMVAGDIRERQHYVDTDDMDRYEENVGGHLYEGDDGQWYYYVGS